MMTLFTDFVLTPGTKFFYGWWFIFVISFMIFLNFGSVIYSTLHTLWLILVKNVRLINHKLEKFITRNDAAETFSQGKYQVTLMKVIDNNLNKVEEQEKIQQDIINTTAKLEESPTSSRHQHKRSSSKHAVETDKAGGSSNS